MKCGKANRDCWGEVALYSFDMDLPDLALCKGHVWELALGECPWMAPGYVKMQVAEELEGLAE